MSTSYGYVARPAGTQPHPLRTSDCPRKQGEQLLAAARAAGDERAEATALTDLAIMSLSEGDARDARGLLEDALAIARRLQNRAREIDVLGNLGLALLALGEFVPGLHLLEQELAQAREADDLVAEKAALERLGLVHAKFQRFDQALRCLERALSLARSLKDRQHQANLLWQLAILHAEQGRREQAIGRAEEAIQLLELMSRPEARLYRDHFERYRDGGTSIASDPGFGAVVVTTGRQPTSVPSVGPGLLRMALSAAKALARFAGTGFRMAPADVKQKRLSVCASCPHHTGLRCRVCGCFTELKARLQHEDCPISQWDRT